MIPCYRHNISTKAGGGTEITDLPRKAITNNATNFPVAASGTKKLHIAQTTAAATGDCARATHWGFHSHASSDHLIVWGPVTVPFTAMTGDTAIVAIDDITISLKNEGE